MTRWEEFAGGTRRAPRFPFGFPVRYRPLEESVWREGEGTNISRSGVLFKAAAPLRLRGILEVSFVMPEIPGETPATVVCQGRVVRQAPRNSPDGVEVAATIEAYRFHRATVPPSA
jgi:hypothetical protein